jgi:GNS1/SUR4 family
MELTNIISMLFYDLADPRSRNKWLMGSPYPLIVWTLAYLSLVKILKLFMKNRRPFNINIASLIVCPFFIVTNGFLCFKTAPFWLFKYNWRCEPLDTSNSQEALLVDKKQNFYSLKPFSYLQTLIRWSTCATFTLSLR